MILAKQEQAKTKRVEESSRFLPVREASQTKTQSRRRNHTVLNNLIFQSQKDGNTLNNPPNPLPTRHLTSIVKDSKGVNL
jgi:hypothetical protein